VRAIVNHYLNRKHRDNRAGGCIIPALSCEISRASDEVRKPFTDALRQYFASIEAFIADSVKEEFPDAELALVATMVGGLLLARVVDDPELSDRILDTCREWAIDRFGKPAGETDDDDPTGPPQD
jgi:TetR/AcrR family transcriptional repressor of nem operon